MSQQVMGTWSVYVDGVNRTFVRGIPITVASMTDTDPFGPGDAVLNLPMVSPLEPVGSPGTELAWLRAEAKVEIVWTTTHDKTLRALNGLDINKQYRWRGFINSIEWSSTENEAGLSITCIGALRILDSLLAKPLAMQRPITYEHALFLTMQEASVASRGRIDAMHELNWDQPGLKWWDKTFNIKDYEGAPNYLKPIDIKTGNRWTGLLTRERGQWDKLLSSYVAGMLSVMYTERGRFTMRLHPTAWRPVLRHINMWDALTKARVLLVEAASPGVSFQLASDYSQSLNVIYGSVRSSYSNTEFNNEQWSANGRRNYFEPFAVSPHVDADNILSASANVMRREQHVQFADGLQPNEAIMVAASHLQRNGEPGLVGSITVSHVDPLMWDTVLTVDGDTTVGGELVPFPKQLIQAGMSIQLNGYQGRSEGPILLINEVTHDVENNSTTMQVDSKYRDFLTTREVQIRGRDALRPMHLMTVGKYDPIVQDRMMPWSYQRSGFVPFKSKPVWDKWIKRGGSKVDEPFPWLNMTRKFPPKTHQNMYLKIPKAKGPKPRGTKDERVTTKAFWSRWKGEKDPTNGLTYLSAAGNISSFKIMCVDEDGNLLPVSFHVSLWWSKHASAADTPQLLAPWDENGRHYKKNTYYPFYPWAWEGFKGAPDPESEYPSGEQPRNLEFRQPTVAPIAGYGTYWDRPGYWPASPQAKGAKRTGMFVDDTGFDYNMMDASAQAWNPHNQDKNTREMNASIQVLVFCDEKINQDKYFIGRLYRSEPGMA